ncbi:hypothetical protein SteCoe_37872 [Stentor coeruleus]|uniref:Uncharacterized protein n=1 Tax=Stentor coeruleus TaxID=5963 RepID=A0A1R2AMJ5_9CILI|nr:hypothetical protein SteCoe_37872 [Stentor coeruleus]
MKLYINEKLGTKDFIKKSFKSLRNFRDVASYLREDKMIVNNQGLEDFLENYIVNLPSIFEIFMKPSYFRKIDETEINGLRKMRRIFIAKYLNLIVNIISERRELEIIEEDYKSLRRFIDRFTETNGEIFIVSSQLVESIDNFMMSTENDNEIKDFLHLFYTLSLTENKRDLYDCYISGDISRYFNFQAFVRILESDQVIFCNDDINLLSESTPISILKLIASFSNKFHSQIMVLGTNFFKYLFTVVTKGVIKLATSTAMIYTLLLEIGLNQLIAALKCGYYKNAIKIEGKHIRLDCRINPRLK